MKMNSGPDNEECLRLLERKDYEELFGHFKDFIKEKVESYIQNFVQYRSYKGDFLQEVYIHILTRSFPSGAFLQACKNGNSFRFYLAKSVKNYLNTLLAKERNKNQYITAIDQLYQTKEEESVLDKSICLADRGNEGQEESKDLLNRLKITFYYFLQNFLETFPKIGYKLILLLKLQARVPIQKQDLKNCFLHINQEDMDRFFESLGDECNYRELEDKEIYQIIYPFFQFYRKEKGSPTALQRWLNQYLSGDEESLGILDKLQIREKEHSYKITDKRFFADFLYDFFGSHSLPAYQNLETSEFKLKENTQETFQIKPAFGV